MPATSFRQVYNEKQGVTNQERGIFNIDPSQKRMRCAKGHYYNPLFFSFYVMNINDFFHENVNITNIIISL